MNDPQKSTKTKQMNQRGPPPSTANGTYLHHLDIGDVGGVRDMRPKSDAVGVGLLQMHDFAFVLRSDGRWTYAILADRTEDTMLFVLSADGRTKTLCRGQWHSHVRLVNGSRTTLSDVNNSSDTDANIDVVPPPFIFLKSSVLTVETDVLSLFD